MRSPFRSSKHNKLVQAIYLKSYGCWVGFFAPPKWKCPPQVFDVAWMVKEVSDADVEKVNTWAGGLIKKLNS